MLFHGELFQGCQSCMPLQPVSKCSLKLASYMRNPFFTVITSVVNYKIVHVHVSLWTDSKLLSIFSTYMDNFHPRWWRIPFAQMTLVTQKGTFLANKTVFVGLTQRRAADIKTIGSDDQQIYFLAIGAPVSDPPTHDETK